MSDNHNPDITHRKSRVFKSGFNVILGSLLFLGVLVGLYWLAGQTNQRIDLTRNQMYSLSDSTRNLLDKLEDRVTVTVYSTEAGAPPEWTQAREELRQLLTQYRNLADGNVQFSLYDVTPDSGTEIEKNAQNAGIEARLMQQASATELKLNKGYFGLVAEYRGKSEAIPFISSSNLEYQLSRIINKVAAVEVPKIAFIAPGGNPLMGQGSQFSILKQELEAESFDVVELQPSDLEGLDEYDMLVLIDSQNLDEEALFHIDQFVMNDGKLFVAAPGVQLSNNRGMDSVMPVSPVINKLLEHYGVRINSNLVEDWEFAHAQTGRMGNSLVRFRNPLLLTTPNKSDDLEITRQLPPLTFLYASTVGHSDLGTSGVVQSLIQTSDNTRLQEDGGFVLDPTELTPPQAEESLKSHNLAMMVSGSLASRYATEEPPTLTNDDGTTRVVADVDIVKRSGGNSQVIVVGSALLIHDQVIQQGAITNLLLPLNAIEGLTRGSDVLALRGRDISMPMLREITPREANITQLVILVGIPVLMILFGFVRMFMNRRRKARYRRVYGGAN